MTFVDVASPHRSGEALTRARGFMPVASLTRVARRRVEPTAYDCVRFLLIRHGSAILCGDCLHHPIRVGDVTLIAPQIVLGYEPEGTASVTTLSIDTDYLIEHLFWQHLDLLPDRDAARDLAAKLYPDPVQVLRPGEREVERLGPILDELVAVTASGQSAAGYFHVHGLPFAVLEAITPHVHHAAVEIPPLTSRQRAARVAAPHWQTFRPVRREAARVAALMRSDIRQPWRLDHLAAHACLSKSQLTRVFKESFGVTPLVCLSILRVQEMARLIRETDLLITVITERVGWCYHTADVQHECSAATWASPPIHYRHYGPPTASKDGPGIGRRASRRSGRSRVRLIPRARLGEVGLSYSAPPSPWDWRGFFCHRRDG